MSRILLYGQENHNNHLSAAERSVKVVTEASSEASGSSVRYGFFRARIVVRRSMPDFETEADYQPGIIDKEIQVMPQGRVAGKGAGRTRNATTSTW
ncbi:hypothetical protein AVEN_228688-1 [Araneus ventricosus]|uniref:Uncharacterized protein n=1 Tax=Araneus ventricosus TaxID=182803 RepID=A0A4Y2S3B1_ARAVE|nr:hypothetical protein AVEN_228688-1 [Araneus ventricosus]